MYERSPEDTPDIMGNLWVRGLDHYARLVCDTCRGSGRLEHNIENLYSADGLIVINDCPVCEGTGHIDVGCGGIGTAERDVHHGMACCLACGQGIGSGEKMMVPLREVPLKVKP